MKTKKRLFVILYMLAVCFHAMAQNAIITGVVVDEDKAFLPGTTVWLKGTNNKPSQTSTEDIRCCLYRGERTKCNFLSWATKVRRWKLS